MIMNKLKQITLTLIFLFLIIIITSCTNYLIRYEPVPVTMIDLPPYDDQPVRSYSEYATGNIGVDN